MNEKEGQEKAQKILKDLEINNMTLDAAEKVLWFPDGSCPGINSVILIDDIYWQADLDKAETGYQYIFSSEIEGIHTKKSNSITAEETQNKYTPPFPVETVAITITDNGVKSFSWKGMAEEVQTVAPNTNLASFQVIQEQLLDQIVYIYSAKEQPANDTTLFGYDITEAQLIYTYITAYQEPNNVWLVPAWYFEVDGEKELQEWYFTINALDGGVIGTAN